MPLKYYAAKILNVKVRGVPVSASSYVVVGRLDVNAEPLISFILLSFISRVVVGEIRYLR